jgi:hypothetical protein
VDTRKILVVGMGSFSNDLRTSGYGVSE